MIVQVGSGHSVVFEQYGPRLSRHQYRELRHQQEMNFTCLLSTIVSCAVFLWAVSI